ncbi:MAG: type 4 pilus major pilin [Pseudomonadota bacterium]
MKYLSSSSFPLSLARRQRGASLLEVIAYLGIAAIVVLGAVSLLTSAFSNAQANRTLEEVVALRTGVKRLYMGQTANYGDASITAQAINAGVVPATLTHTANTITNAWNGTVTITGATNVFRIAYANVPQAACIALLSGATGWSSVKGEGTKLDNLTGPVTPAQAATTCQAGDNDMEWEAN